MATKPRLTEELMLLRRRKGWSVEKVAADLMVSEGTVRSWQDPERTPHPDHRERIRDYIDLHTLHDQSKEPKG
jgi:ribosome-binding protein aMBF1 (putative translation factor)